MDDAGAGEVLLRRRRIRRAARVGSRLLLRLFREQVLAVLVGNSRLPENRLIHSGADRKAVHFALGRTSSASPGKVKCPANAENLLSGHFAEDVADRTFDADAADFAVALVVLAAVLGVGVDGYGDDVPVAFLGANADADVRMLLVLADLARSADDGHTQKPTAQSFEAILGTFRIQLLSPVLILLKSTTPVAVTQQE